MKYVKFVVGYNRKNYLAGDENNITEDLRVFHSKCILGFEKYSIINVPSSIYGSDIGITFDGCRIVWEETDELKDHLFVEDGKLYVSGEVIMDYRNSEDDFNNILIFYYNTSPKKTEYIKSSPNNDYVRDFVNIIHEFPSDNSALLYYEVSE